MLSDEIKEFNLTYLVLSQRLIREDKEAALVVLNIDSETAEFFIRLTAKELSAMASSNQLICKPAFDKTSHLAAVLSNEKKRGLTETHVALLLAGATASSINDLEKAAQE